LEEEDQGTDDEPGSPSSEPPQKLVEVVITPDHLTTGLLEDFQLVVQLIFD